MPASCERSLYLFTQPVEIVLESDTQCIVTGSGKRLIFHTIIHFFNKKVAAKCDYDAIQFFS